jgi:hypothetical protein
MYVGQLISLFYWVKLRSIPRHIWLSTGGLQGFKRRSSMGNATVRKEVMKFFEATQILLSVPETDLTTDESLLIAYYVNSLAEPERPWGQFLAFTTDHCRTPSVPTGPSQQREMSSL